MARKISRVESPRGSARPQRPPANSRLSHALHSGLPLRRHRGRLLALLFGQDVGPHGARPPAPTFRRPPAAGKPACPAWLEPDRHGSLSPTFAARVPLAPP